MEGPVAAVGEEGAAVRPLGEEEEEERKNEGWGVFSSTAGAAGFRYERTVPCAGSPVLVLHVSSRDRTVFARTTPTPAAGLCHPFRAR